MTQLLKVYLSGPDVFLPDAQAVLAAKAKLVEQYGFQPAAPADGSPQPRAVVPDAATDGKGLSRLIYAANVAMMREADFAICNLTPFRGPSADPGTVFELGMMVGLGKPVFAYTNSGEAYLQRIGTKSERPGSIPPAWTDILDCSIENFGNCDNLMLDGAAEATGGIITGWVPMSAFYTSLAGFGGCLAAAQKYFAGEEAEPAAAAAGRPAIPLAP